MREIKFRIYDEEMRVIKYLNDRHDSTLFDDNGNMKYYNLQGGYTGILMQYTGLKDKNGKEIYEGDIVKTYFLGNLEAIGDIRFYRGTFVIVDSEYTNYHLSWYEKIFEYVGNEKDIEVVGNIYENPELIGDDE